MDGKFMQGMQNFFKTVETSIHHYKITGQLDFTPKLLVSDTKESDYGGTRSRRRY